jgi:hypothetical protein
MTAPAPTESCAARLPRGANRILRDQRVRAEDDQTVDDGLAHEHPVERVAMERRQSPQMESGFLVELQSVVQVYD